MLDDDIQYMGSKSAPPLITPSLVRPFPSPQNPVTGVVLHVEANSGQPACSMSFQKSQTSAVTIGRKSSSDHKSGLGDDDANNVGFVCQVVSGKHAKLTFSDSGFVYLIDLGSRHGTHILHPGDTISRMLDSEVSTILCDGDIVTFGKTVGKGSYVVPPVTVRVELIFEKSTMTSTNPVTRTPVTAPEMSRKSSSGRYGLFVPSSLSSPDSSDDELSSKYDHDSDIEEIAPPTSMPDRESHNVFPLSLPGLPNLRGLAEAHFFGTDCPDFHAFSFGSSLDDVRLPALDKPLEQSRSHSPMELSSPTPTPVGAWPSHLAASAAASASASAHEQGQGARADQSPGGSSNKENETLQGDAQVSQPLFSEFGSTPSRAASESMRSDHREHSISPSHHTSSDDESQSPSPPSEFDLKGREKGSEVQDRMAELNATISQIKRDIAEAAAKREHCQPLSDDGPHCDELLDLMERVEDAEFLSSNLEDRLDATDDQVSSLREHVAQLQEQADNLAPVLQDSTNEAVAEVKVGVAALHALLAEMRDLHEKMEQQMSIKLASVEAARAALVVATSEAQTAVSLKRKHSEMEAEDQASAVFDAPAVQTIELINDGTEKPRRKRIRRIVSAVMHTATAATIGAVATWSALAFS